MTTLLAMNLHFHSLSKFGGLGLNFIPYTATSAYQGSFSHELLKIGTSYQYI